MKASEIRDLSNDELQQDKKTTRKAQRLVSTHPVSAIEKPSDIQYLRRTIARLKTIIRERELETSKN